MTTEGVSLTKPRQTDEPARPRPKVCRVCCDLPDRRALPKCKGCGQASTAQPEAPPVANDWHAQMATKYGSYYQRQAAKPAARVVELPPYSLARPPAVLEPPIPRELPLVRLTHAQPRQSALAPQVTRIIDTVCAVYCITCTEMMSKDRHPSISWARQLAIALCREYMGLSYPELGRVFGNRDHTTMMSAVRRIQRGPRNVLEEDRWERVREALSDSDAPRPFAKVRVVLEDEAGRVSVS